MIEYTDEFDIESFIAKCMRELELDEEVGRMAKEIVRRAVEIGIPSGKSPAGHVSAAVYIASILTKHRVTQNSLAKLSGVSEATIRKRYMELAKGLGYYSS